MKPYSTFESELQVRPDDIDMNGQIQNSDIQLKLNPNIGKGEQYSGRMMDLRLYAKRRNNDWFNHK